MTASILSPSLQDIIPTQNFTTLATKRCSKCQRYLPLSQFSTDRHKTDGLRTHCKSCCAIAHNTRTQNKKNDFQDIVSAGVYFIANEHKIEHLKIGFTTNIYRRFKDHLCSTSGKLLLLSVLDVQDKEPEYLLHQQFKNLRINPESEWFLAKSSLLSFLSSLNQSLAHKSISVLTPYQQSRIIVPPIERYIDAVPFLG